MKTYAVYLNRDHDFQRAKGLPREPSVLVEGVEMSHIDISTDTLIFQGTGVYKVFKWGEVLSYEKVEDE